MNYWNDITELQQMLLEPHVRQVLDNFTFSLSLVLGDDAKINREAQMMHSIQMSLGNKTDSLEPASEYETTTFCLFFDNLVCLTTYFRAGFNTTKRIIRYSRGCTHTGVEMAFALQQPWLRSLGG